MRIAVIVPRFGPDIAGGAENLARGFAIEANRRGWQVEVWTTCVKAGEGWQNELAPGPTTITGLAVRRFPVSRFDLARRQALETRMNTQGRLEMAEQYAWLETGPHSPTLYKHIAWEAGGFDWLIALPYPNPLVHYAAWLAPEKTILWPCLHDEPYAYLEPVRLLLESVYGVAFNSPEEADIVRQGLGLQPAHTAILGVGATLVEGPGTSEKEGPADQRPYLLYIGRLEAGKNLNLLYEYVGRLWEAGERVRLVIIGEGPLTPPNHPAFEFSGYVDEPAKAELCAGALALCQPSVNESFSLAAMESWLAGRPVLVSAGCAVTRGHTRRSKGGLWFGNYPEFGATVDWLLANPELAERMGANGRRYVQANYTWPAVVDRFDQALKDWQASDSAEAKAIGGQG